MVLIQIYLDPAVREICVFYYIKHLLGAEREPSNARLPEVSEYDFTLQTDGRNYNIDVFFQSTSE